MSKGLPEPLENILGDIKRAFAAGIYYPALTVALTIPEVCSALAMPKKQFVKQADYVAFVDKYTVERQLGIEGLGCYQLRGGVIHRGNAAGHPFLNSTHVLFFVPETGGTMHCLTLENGEKRAICIGLKMFCDEMDRAARAWFEANKDNPTVKTNVAALLSWKPQGLHPFVVGVPLIGSGID